MQYFINDNIQKIRTVCNLKAVNLDPYFSLNGCQGTLPGLLSRSSDATYGPFSWTLCARSRHRAPVTLWMEGPLDLYIYRALSYKFTLGKTSRGTGVPNNIDMSKYLFEENYIGSSSRAQ